ncbi:HNH endonuclease family protein [Streptomyces phaeochromogenes]|uniref:HNH endonuclease family protein n=1 Tax=Streptomyces phaeochromogenes TaxID=1923 RepID=UPI002E29C4F4|nr:HNH endonuclease family protein [Streptomyces phaeochromogenes]
MTTTPWPVLLYLHATEEVPNDQRAVAARAIDSFLTRRAVCLITTKDYNRLFVQVLADAQESDPARAGCAVVRSLWNQTAEARLWPDDQILLEALITPDLYRRSYRARLKALLVGLENHLRTPKTELAPILSSLDSRLNIEHVLPQKWETHWPLADGDSEKALEKRHGAVHQLGNLTLTTTKLNPSLSNREWLRKKDELRAHSLLRLTTSSVLSVPEGLDQKWTTDRWVESWDGDRIQLRTLWLAGIALRAWPKPKADVD